MVRHRPGGRITRCIYALGGVGAVEAPETELIIQDADGEYSTEFRALLGEFYLAL
jgi:hypothetical protein